MELERLQKILEFNKLKNTSTPPSINSPSYRLSETWNQTIQKEKEPIHETKIQSTNEPYTSVDYNLLLSYFILTTITAFLCYAFIGILF